MVESPKAMTMVRTMTQLGRRLKLEVVAEGVEQVPQLDLLRRLHCHDAQGYIFAPPIDADAMTSFLREWCRKTEPQSYGLAQRHARRQRLSERPSVRNPRSKRGLCAPCELSHPVASTLENHDADTRNGFSVLRNHSVMIITGVCSESMR